MKLNHPSLPVMPLHYFLLAALTVLGPSPLAAAAASEAGGCAESGGNWYCSRTNAITYTNFGQKGTYRKVTGMNVTDGSCASETQAYEGGLAPLDGEVSWHFRGPMRLKGFAAYKLAGGGPVVRREAREEDGHGLVHRSHRRRHSHGLHHGRRDVEGGEVDRRAVGNSVTATIDGKVVSWVNEYDGSPANAAPAKPSGGSGAVDAGRLGPAPDDGENGIPQPDAPAEHPVKSNPDADDAGDTPGRVWLRSSYYTSSSPSTTENLVFLGAHGSPTCSGTFDLSFGLSQSYVDSTGQHCSPDPQPLSDVLLPDNTEINIFTAAQCTDSDLCPYARPGSVAHHGFDGESKLFLVEFEMPLSGRRGEGLNDDMPAMWMLNAQVPRTQQYGACSCWTSGCGEFDVMEVLSSGEQRMKSAWHGLGATGSSDWFERPAEGTSRKAAVVMDGRGGKGKVSVFWLDEEVEFGEKVSAEEVAGWLARAGERGMGKEMILGTAQ